MDICDFRIELVSLQSVLESDAANPGKSDSVSPWILFQHVILAWLVLSEMLGQCVVWVYRLV